MNGEAALPVATAFFFVAAGLIMLVGGGELLVSGATRLARRWGMTTLVIGLTVVAFGTSVPELFVSLSASLQGHPDIMIGNIIGSNIANIGLVLGISAMLRRLQMTLREVWTELLLVVAGSIILMICSSLGNFPRSIGLVFILTLVSYTYFTFRNHQNNTSHTQETDKRPETTTSPALPVLLVTGGLILLTIGSDIFIRGAVDVARHFDVSELVIGLTLAAIGTSLPELASCMSALRRNESGLLIGNVIGSNLFNLFMVMGLTGFIIPFSLSATLLHRDLPVMIAFTIALIAILLHTKGTNRWHGMLFFGSYCVYCFILL
jgi:cation:H+ antiporter